jgi:hypothetical protein
VTACLTSRRRPWATRALFRHVLPALGVEAVDTVWEPACGEGHMAEIIAEFSTGQVVASDIYDYGCGQPARLRAQASIDR